MCFGLRSSRCLSFWRNLHRSDDGSRVLPALRGLMARAASRGELPNDALARFPQLLVAPAMVALVWNGLFERFAPLDVQELLRAHIEILFGERSAP